MELGTKKKFIGLAVAVTLTAMGCANKMDQASTLDPRFRSNDAVQFVQDGASVTAASGQVSSLASGLTVALSLTINAPPASATGGQQLYASDLRIYGNKIITAYNVPGNVQRGWIDYIDVTAFAIPFLLGSHYFADTDVNSVAMANGKFALVGAKENMGSVLRTGTFSGFGFSLSATETFPTGNYVGTGVTFNSAGTNIALTTGDQGNVSVINGTTLGNVNTASLLDARGITYSSVTNKYYVIKGKENNVNQVIAYDANGTQTGASASLGGGTIAQSKATIVAGNEFLLATTGEGGFTVLCASDLGIAAQQAQFTYANYAALGLPAPSLTVSNAAAFGPGMIFVAAGQAGVRVYNFIKKTGVSPTACQNVQVSYMGYLEFNNTLSANNLVYTNVLTSGSSYAGILYVANGGGGFKAVTISATHSSLNDIIDF